MALQRCPYCGVELDAVEAEERLINTYLLEVDDETRELKSELMKTRSIETVRVWCPYCGRRLRRGLFDGAFG